MSRSLGERSNSAIDNLTKVHMLRAAHSTQTKIKISEGLKNSKKKHEHGVIGTRAGWHCKPRKSEILLCGCGNKYIRTRGEAQMMCIPCLGKAMK